MSLAPFPNFYLWGRWKTRTICEPFLTKKMSEPVKKVVLGESFIITLTEKGEVWSWGKDSKRCLGHGAVPSKDMPTPIAGLSNVVDIQMGDHHVVALTKQGEVFCWGDNSLGQLGLGSDEPTKKKGETPGKPQQVEKLRTESIMQIAVIRNSTYALATSGVVWAWGDNKDNILGLSPDQADKIKKDTGFTGTPTLLTLLSDKRVRKLEVVDQQTMIAHIQEPEDGGEEAFGLDDPKHQEQEGPQEIDIFEGIKEMQKTMEKTQEWWNHLIHIKHGAPYKFESKADYSNPAEESSVTDLEKEDQEALENIEGLRRAEKHLDRLVHEAVERLKLLTKPGTRNARFILCLFIDECRLRKEKVQRTIAVHKLREAREAAAQGHRMAFADGGGGVSQSRQELIGKSKDLQTWLDTVKACPWLDVGTRELKLTLIMMLESKLQLLDTQVQQLNMKEGEDLVDIMLPALRIIKDRWTAMKNFSLFQMYNEYVRQQEDTGGDAQDKDNPKLMEELVRSMSEKIDEFLQIDKVKIIARDSLVPVLCYDLLRENAELRKRTYKYQLQVLLLFRGQMTPEDRRQAITDAGGGDSAR